jgi:hypothetical protein
VILFVIFDDTTIGRGERIRTSGNCFPKAVLYQAELHPVEKTMLLFKQFMLKKAN